MPEGIREFISALEDAGELYRVSEEIDWKYGIGDRTNREFLKGKDGAALLFENILEYPGHRVLTNGLGSVSRLCIALGLPPGSTFNNAVAFFLERCSHPIDPTIIDHAGCEDLVATGEDVDLTALPVPWWSREDVGRYIGTWHINISKDPDSGVRNVGVYRMQLLDRRRTFVSISPGSHLACHLGKAKAAGKHLEMSVAIGVDERLVMAGAVSLGFGFDEYRIAGGLAGTATLLSHGKTVAVETPVNSEIVLEGRIDPNKTGAEGPFLDYAGIPKSNPNAYFFDVTCVRCKRSPVFRGAAIGIPGAEDHLLYALVASAGLLDFHGSRVRKTIQNHLLKLGFFRTFQAVGTIGSRLGKRT